MESVYRTIKQQAADEFVERRSRFIGAICPVSNESAALEFIVARRKEHWSAKHTVYAYVLREGQVRRYSDDGEPQGTGGVPVLEVLLKAGLTDCVVAVTRYFGGILLGTGGLVRAYSHAAKLAMDATGVVEMRLCDRACIACEYAQYGLVAALIPEMGGFVTDTRYTDRVELDFSIPHELLGPVQAQLTERSAGSLTAEFLGQEYLPFDVKAPR